MEGYTFRYGERNGGGHEYSPRWEAHNDLSGVRVSNVRWGVMCRLHSDLGRRRSDRFGD